MKVHKQQLIIFTRFPAAGKTKTRLIPHLGAEGAARLQREMTEHTVKQAKKSGAPIEIRYTGGTLEQMRDWLGGDLQYAEQGEGDLGVRMQRAFEVCFQSGEGHVVIIGSDCPSNEYKNIRQAFNMLEHHDGVIGPASDGGYYLIGLSKRAPQLFQNIDWGGGHVFNQTTKAASDLLVHMLPMLHDVDLMEDIPLKISVIIPALNEERHLPVALDKVKDGFNIELIVVDGGSTDGTRNICPDAIECREGRAAQLNLGASNAAGEILLFLHADTELPEGWDWEVRKILADETIGLGAFAFKIREPFAGQKIIEWATNFRARKKLPYGDQGLFVRKSLFAKVGGFPNMPIMEDYAFVRLIGKHGKISSSSMAAITSGRRWVKHGAFKVTLINQMMIAGYHLGISTEKLAAFYQKS